MSENKSYIIYPSHQSIHSNVITEFFNGNGVVFSSQLLIKDGLIEMSSNDLINFSTQKIFKYLGSLCNYGDWYRLLEMDEYGSEIFWYIDSQTSWKIILSQDELNLNSLRAYRYWHKNLGSINYGVLSEEDLCELEELYGEVDITKPFQVVEAESLNSMVSGNLDFLGKGYLVPYAPELWDWYILDHECLALETARCCEFPPVDGVIKYRRTFIINGDAGYVWSWSSGDVEIFLIFNFYGQYSCNKRLIKNTDGLTLDELIIVAYFYKDYEYGFERLDEWVISSDPEKDQFYSESLECVYNSLFEVRTGFNYFDGRVITANRGVLIRSVQGDYYLAEFQGAERDENYILINDASINDRVREYVPHLYESLGRGVCCEIKLRIKHRLEISGLLGCRFFGEAERGKEKIIGEIPVKLNPVRHLLSEPCG